MDGRKILKTLTKMKMLQNDNVLEVGGFSMIPLLVAGDFIKIVEQKSYKTGDIVVCVDERNGQARLVVHRVISVCKKDGERVYTIKGDNAIAAEIIESEFCLGKVVEINNKNGKKITVNTPSEKDNEIVSLSREVWSLYKKTGDPTIAFSSKPHMKIYDMAPDYLKEYVFAAQKEMIKRGAELVQGLPPSPPDPNFEFSKDFYFMLALHRVTNVLDPYVIEGSGRYGKHIKLSKARNLTLARRRFKKACEISEEFEKEGIKYLIFKGLASSYFIYGDPNIRECDDVDFLILPEDVQRSHEILRRLGYAYHDERGFYWTEEPEEHYHTHIQPYIHETDHNTVELHTAIFTKEVYTESVLANRKLIDIDGHMLYVLSDIEAFLCQLFVTAVDDYAASNMTYEMDPNIFFQLKFRNYLDIGVMAVKYSHLSQEEIIKTAMKYDLNFHIFFAADFTCRIFEQAPFTEMLQQLRDKFISNEQLDDSMYYLPVGIQDCLQSPFKMKMNGRVLCHLRDGYTLSSGWRRAQQEIEKGDFTDIKSQGVYKFSSKGITGGVKQTAKYIKVDIQTEIKEQPDEFILVFKSLLKDKYKKPGDEAYDVRFVYVNKREGYYRKGKVLQNTYMPMDEFSEAVTNYIHGIGKTPKFRLYIGKKHLICHGGESLKAELNCLFCKNTLLGKNGHKYMVFSAIFVDITNSKFKKEIILNKKDEEILKFSFD